MAIIYTYPTKASPAADDLILISDSADSNKTKQVKVSALPSSGAGITLTTTGTSGVATLTGSVLNIPNYTTTGGTLSVQDSGGTVVAGIDTLNFNTDIAVVTAPGSSTATVNVSGGSGTPEGNDTQIQYNNNGAFGGTTGLTWDDSNNILSIGTRFEGDINGALLQQVIVKEVGGVSKGDIVYISGGTGDNPEVKKAQANASITMPALGIMKANTAENATGECVTSGEITGLGSLLTGISTGDELFVSSTTAGGFQTSAPTGEANLIQKIGKVIKGGTGGALTVLGAFRTNATPNLNQGSLFIGNASNQATTLGIGGNNTVLKSNGTTATWAAESGISFSGSTANGIATYSSASIANVSSNLTIDNVNKKLNIGSTYSIQDSSAVFKIGSLSSTQAQESIEFHINGAQKVKVNEDGRLVASVGSAANPNLKLGTGNDGIYGTTNTLQLITNGNSKISISDGNAADIQMNDLVEFGSGLRFGATGETLSSYEEGTWTPAPWVFSGTAPTVESANGTYTIIGDICHITFQIVVSGSSSGNAAMILNGLPTVAQGDATTGEQSAGQLFVNTDSNTYNAIPSMFFVAGDKLTMVVQGGSKNSLTSPYGLKAQDVVANWYRPSAGSGITLKGSATYKLL
jgi:hypothetical protein